MMRSSITCAMFIFQIYCASCAHEVLSPSDVVGIELDYYTDHWGVVDFKPIPSFYIDTHDPVTQDHHVSASVHNGDTPWNHFIWDRIVSLTPSVTEVRNNKLVFVDVGANLGYFSMAAASLGYDVVAFEPTSKNANKLAKSIQRNNFGARVKLYQNVVTDISGQHLVLQAADGIDQGAGKIFSPRIVIGVEPNGIYGMDYATSVTLSNVMRGKNAFIVKIDVEGHESEVLGGARDWICNNVIRHIIIGISDSSKANSETSLYSLIQFLKSSGYEMADVAVGSSVLQAFDVLSLPANVLFSLTGNTPDCL
jgi:FkbM family methyltransferase